MTNDAALEIGRDVPWVTAWSGEAILGFAPCPSVDGALAMQQDDRPGEGRPLYAQNHMIRQRLTVRGMLCPMCGQPTAAGDRWSQTGRYITAGDVRERGLGAALPADMGSGSRLLDAGAIAPLHRACADAALTRCPHLAGMPDAPLKPFPRSWVVIPLLAQPAAGHALAARRPPPVVAFLQLVGIC